MLSRRRPIAGRLPAAGGASLASLVLRAALGGTFIAHGHKHATSLDGTSNWFASMGFRAPGLQARTSAAVEIGSGAAIVAGAVIPLSTSAVVGTMAVAYCTVHRPNGYFVTSEGWEYVGFVSAAALALSALGAGPASVDRRLGLDAKRSASLRTLATLGTGLLGAAAQLAVFWRPPSDH